MKPYDHTKIEKKWQKEWAAKKIYKTGEKGEKFYILDMFPYPSGEGLHVGHPKGYIATDIVSRMKRMQGFNVLHPMGFDAFGLPAENYAIKMKTNPAVAVAKNVARYKKQLEILGFDYDWSREVITTDPKFYKWTQWIFLKLLEKGLAFESFEPVNWCPFDKTVLANEDVENGRCERCGTLVEKKLMRQWVLKITNYADRLLQDLDATTGIPMVIRTKGEDAVKKELPFIERQAVVCIIKHWSEDKYLCVRWKATGWQGFVIGGIEKGEDVGTTGIREIREETGFKNIRFVREVGKVDAKFFQKVKGVNRHAHFNGAYFELINGERTEIDEEEKKLHDNILWLSPDEVRPFTTHADMTYLWDLYTGAKKQEITPLLDWPESIKESQRNWIGRSEGAEIDFNLVFKKNPEDNTRRSPDGKPAHISVFTTRPDTIFGVTYIVLSPEHLWVRLATDGAHDVLDNKKEVIDYVKSVAAKTDIERTSEGKEKTGIPLKGVVAINPATGEEIPMYVADYVLADYGTGAVMAVPAHDIRDFDFAKKYKLPITQVIVPFFENSADLKVRKDMPTVRRENVQVILRDPTTDKYLLISWKKQGWKSMVTGGIEKGEDVVTAGMREIKEEAGYTNVRHIAHPGSDWEVHSLFYVDHKKENRYQVARGVMFELVDTAREEISKEESDKHALVWLSKDEVHDYLTHDNQQVIWNYFNAKQVYTGHGKLIHSGKFNDASSESVKKQITESVGGTWVTRYKLRDWVFSRQRYWGEPIPVIHTGENGQTIIPLTEKDLPLTLPKVKSYEPTGTGESPLANISKWVNVKIKIRGEDGKMKTVTARRETNTMPQWAGSSWYYLRYMDPKNNKKIVDPKKEKYWNTVDLYVGGAEHATRHLIYARFWHKFLYDIGVVSTTEPFKKLQSVGLIMAEDGRKMSKRWGNVINPDEMVERYGADTLRLYEMFMGPFDQAIGWNTNGLIGTRRFIERVWRLADKVQSAKSAKNTKKIQSSPAAQTTLHKAIKKVGEDIALLHFNTAVSTLMITLNDLEKEVSITRNDYQTLLKILAPFAPHVADELWHEMGNKKSIHIETWPKFDPKKIVASMVTMPVQINGRIRATLNIAVDATEEEVKASALVLSDVKKWMEGETVVRIVFVPGKIINFLTKKS